MGGAEQTADRHCGAMNGTPLPLSLGEVSERSEDGEGKQGCKTLSVTFGDSSPKGRAKGLYPHIGMRNGAHLYRCAPFAVLRPPMKAGADGLFHSYSLWYFRCAFTHRPFMR